MPGARPRAVAGNLNLLEFTREDVRWQRPHTILEENGVLMFAGRVGLPRVQQRRAPGRRHRFPATEVIARAREFFAARDRGFSVWIRDTGEDDDLAGGVPTPR